MTLQDRCQNYQKIFPKWPPPVVQNNRIHGIWIMGNDYRGSGYHGAYPPNYLRRVMALFPDRKKILHLFSGSLPKGDYIRFDLRKDVDCDMRGNAEEISKHFPNPTFDLILADPPYTDEDAHKYGNPMVNRNKVLHECWKVLYPEGYVVWLDQVLPMYSKNHWILDGVIGIVRSTMHRFRCCVIFRKKRWIQEPKMTSLLLGLK